MRKVLVGAAAVAAAGAAILGFTASRVQARAWGDVDEFLQHNGTHGALDGRRVVVCAGASIVRGRASVDWVDIIRSRYRLSCDVVNAGVNGNLAIELERRLGGVLACHPADVIVLVGTNDVQAWLSPAVAAAAQRTKHLAEPPSPVTFRAALDEIVAVLTEVGVRVALCSLPPLGQDLQSPANTEVRRANEIIANVARVRGATYLPVYERMAATLAANGAAAAPPFTGSVRPGLESLVRRFVLRQSYDEISESHGLVLSPDLIHLNSAGAGIVASLAGEFLGPVPG